ncbi:MAG: haloalkane dehalogenase [Chromatiales bacterium]|nr:MAG: haloalkane dehalogenase [Chromatiales bacterium]
MSTATETRFYDVLDHSMACREAGTGDPVVFLHGNPTSSYLWRDVMPEIAGQARCLAPDLIGMGQSQKLANSNADSYRFNTHRRYLDALLEQLDLGDAVTLVLHDWGSALGFDWARRHPERVRGLVYMEALVRPLKWSEWPEAGRSLFQAFRSASGEDLVLQKNLFVERVLPGSIIRELGTEEMAAYRTPFENPGEDRRPTLTWPRELPIDGTPADVVAVVSEYAAWLARCEIPKLFINAKPGAILTGAPREFCRSWPNQSEVTVRGIHFIQEDSGPEIGAAIADWLRRLP